MSSINKPWRNYFSRLADGVKTKAVNVDTGVRLERRDPVQPLICRTVVIRNLAVEAMLTTEEFLTEISKEAYLCCIYGGYDYTTTKVVIANVEVTVTAFNNEVVEILSPVTQYRVPDIANIISKKEINAMGLFSSLEDFMGRSLRLGEVSDLTNPLTIAGRVKVIEIVNGMRLSHSDLGCTHTFIYLKDPRDSFLLDSLGEIVFVEMLIVQMALLQSRRRTGDLGLCVLDLGVTDNAKRITVDFRKAIVDSESWFKASKELTLTLRAISNYGVLDVSLMKDIQNSL